MEWNGHLEERHSHGFSFDGKQSRIFLLKILSVMAICLSWNKVCTSPKKEISILSRTSQASSKVTCLTNPTLNNTGALKLLCKVWGSNQHSLMCIPISVLTSGGCADPGKRTDMLWALAFSLVKGEELHQFYSRITHIRESLQNPGSWALGPSAPMSLPWD